MCIAAVQLQRYTSDIHSTNSIMLILSLSCSKKHKAESRQGQYNRRAQGGTCTCLWGLLWGGCLHSDHCDTWCHVQAHHQNGSAAWCWTSMTASVLPAIYKHHRESADSGASRRQVSFLCEVPLLKLMYCKLVFQPQRTYWELAVTACSK